MKQYADHNNLIGKNLNETHINKEGIKIMKAIEIEKTVKEITGYEASDGTKFKDMEECIKYENTCKCVIMAAFKKLIICQMSEYDFYVGEAGCEDFCYNIVRPESMKDIETINKALVFVYKDARQLTPEYIGKNVIVFADYSSSNEAYGSELTGCFSTLEDKINEIRNNFNKKIEKAIQEKENKAEGHKE